MKKKKKLLTKKQKRILIIIGVIILISLIIILIPLSNREHKNEEINANELGRKLTTIQEVVEYLESTYIREEESNEEGYDIDIYVSFKYDLYENGKSNELYFTNFYEKIAIVTEFKNFRIIDEGKGITIALKCNSNKISEVLINGETEYFKKHDSENSRENELKIEEVKMTINSSILQSLIDANWNSAQVNLGTQESTYSKYQIYFDEGYEIRTIDGKVYNLVFTNKYNEKVVSDYKVGDSIERIEGEFGTSYKATGIIGYKTKDFYIFFLNDEISIYPNYEYDYTEFEELVRQYNENKDINDFMYYLTDIWPDYDRYIYDTTYFEIWYTLKGVKISYNSTNPTGIEIYENYNGALKNSEEDYYNVYYKLDENLMIERDKIRRMEYTMYDNSGIENDPIHYSNRFYFQATKDGEYYTNVKILSLDDNFPRNELDDTIEIYKYVWADDSHLIYSIRNEGIYIYNAETRSTENLITGTDDYEITSYDRNSQIIEYDGTQAKVEY